MSNRCVSVLCTCVCMYVCVYVSVVSLCQFLHVCVCVGLSVSVCVWNLELRLLAGHHLHEFYKEKNEIKIVYN